MEEERKVINPIYPEYIPRLSPEFVKLYNETGALSLAGHQVPIEEVLFHIRLYWRGWEELIGSQGRIPKSIPWRTSALRYRRSAGRLITPFRCPREEM